MDAASGTHELRVRSMALEAEDVLSIVLETVDGRDLPEFEYGSHIDFMMRPDLIRQYSLCGQSNLRSQWTVAVLLETESRGGSTYVHEVLRPGMTVTVAGPRSNFKLVDAERYLFIAGGIGITPLLPMVRHVAAEGKDWKMLYGGRRRASMAFVNELSQLGPRVTIAPEDECGLLDLKGAIDSLASDAAVYCCGPEGLISAVEAMCATLGRPAPRVERFGARPKSDDEDVNDANESFDIVLSMSGQRLTIPADKSIIEVLKESGYSVVTSCEEGYCGTCETVVVSGIPDHRDEYLDPEERASNERMMICCGRSKTPELVLKL
jgi:ferredoxin-NADP reductase